jgi:hypothetical protein
MWFLSPIKTYMLCSFLFFEDGRFEAFSALLGRVDLL